MPGLRRPDVGDRAVHPVASGRGYPGRVFIRDLVAISAMSSRAHTSVSEQFGTDSISITIVVFRMHTKVGRPSLDASRQITAMREQYKAISCAINALELLELSISTRGDTKARTGQRLLGIRDKATVSADGQ